MKVIFVPSNAQTMQSYRDHAELGKSGTTQKNLVKL